MAPGETVTLAHAVGALVGADRVRLPRPAEAGVAQVVVEPATADEIAEIVRKCERDRLTLAPMGAARTLKEMRSVPVALGISLARMNRLIDYQAEDMTVVAEAGLSLARLNATTGQRRQHLPCDPAVPELTTLGALVGAAKTGPSRLREGAPRDLLLGIGFVGHSGRVVHGGGRVVKNVAGYDLMKVMTGSFGTLGIITETTFKVRPLAENYSLALAAFEATGEALAAAQRAATAAELIHLEVLSNALGERFDRPGRSLVLAGFGGARAEVDQHRALLSNALRRNAAVLTGARALADYQRLRDLDFAATAVSAQMAVLPAELAHCLVACGAEFRAHAASGIAQLFLPNHCTGAELREAVTRWREIAHQARGHLRVLGARADARTGLELFDQPPPPAMSLMRRLKHAFDPSNVFNPGCFVGGL